MKQVATKRRAPHAAKRIDVGFAGVALGILALGILLRILPIGRESLWFDEIFAASYTNLSVWETAIAVLRFEIHPPLYYMQLTAWSFFGHSDIWLLLNSVAWSGATLVALLVFVGRRFGRVAGLWAMAVCALLGSEIYFAGELRQYAMLSTVAVLTWAAAERFLIDRSFRGAWPLGLVLFPMAAMHSAVSLITISGLLLYIMPLPPLPRHAGFVRWIKICLVAFIAILPWLINANFRSISHTHSFTVDLALQTVGGWVLGYGAGLDHTLYQVIGAILLPLLAILTLRVPETRRLFICLILWPLIFGVLLSVAIRPIWLDRVFAFCAPFVAIVIGTALARCFSRQSAPPAKRFLIAGTVLIAVACIYVAWLQAVAPRKTEYRELVRDLKAQASPGEIIYVPHNITFWAVARYLVGPEWGSILEVQDAIQPDDSETWRKIYARLGPQKLQWLGLSPRVRQIDSLIGPLVIGWSPVPSLQQAKSFWVVGNYTVDLNKLSLCAPRQVATQVYRGVLLHHVRCSGG